MRGRLAFVGEIRGEDHFVHHAVARARLQPVEPDVARAGAVVLQQVVGHAPRGARADAGERTQSFDQALEPLRGRNCVPVQNGSLNPAGSPSPAVMPLIFSAIVASTLRAASLKAAATRSS